MGAIRGCLSRIGCLTLLVLGVTLGWLYRAEIEAGWSRAVAGAGARVEGDVPVGSSAVPSVDDGEPAAPVPGPGAVEAEGASPSEPEPSADDVSAGEEGGDRVPTGFEGAAIEAFLAAPVPASLRLDDRALALLVEERVEPGLPAGVARAAATVGDSTLAVAADVDLRRVLGERLPSMLARMIGDSARVRAHVHPSVPEHGVLRLRVRELRAGSVGVPTMTLPWLLTELGLPLAPDDPTAVDLEVGRELAEARVEAGTLVLERRSPAAVPAGR